MNESVFFATSIIIQKNEITIKLFVKSANGLINIDSPKFPCISCKVALVEPQAGQGIPVTCLNTQKLYFTIVSV